MSTDSKIKENYENIGLFIKENPDLAPSKPKDLRQYKEAYEARKEPKEPLTVSDSVVSLILSEFYGYGVGDVPAVVNHHRHAMAAENIVGYLLEKYLATKLEPLGWIWCCGEVVRSVDFLKYDSKTKEWTALQVKNRDNTENSSSSKVRKGTEIQKWFRSFSKKSDTNWQNFPDETARKEISEKGFEEFIKNYL